MVIRDDALYENDMYVSEIFVPFGPLECSWYHVALVKEVLELIRK